MKRIAILVHERHADAAERSYIIWTLRDIWRTRGIEVEVVRGAEAVPDADLLIPQLDLTVIPDEYGRILDAHPNVLNRGVRDISKRVISRQLVRAGDGWTGPVIVKSNRNAQGRQELRLLGVSRRERMERVARRLVGRWPPSLGSTLSVKPRKYRVFESVEELPRGVLRNENLVVERFLPERDGERYALRIYTFLGSRDVCSVRYGDNPVLKAADAGPRTKVDVPAEIVAERTRLGFDFGKFDFVVHEGEPVLLDANWTPVYNSDRLTAEQRQRSERLADGIEQYLGCV